MITKSRPHLIALGGLVLLLGGCASVPQKGGFEEVKTEVANRTGHRVEWRQSSDEDQALDREVNALLEKSLTPESAVQIALLNNRHLQATYEELGIAQANLVQAGLLSNPIFSAEIGFVEGGGSPDLLFGVTQNFLSILFQPLRKSIAEAEFAAARQRVAAQAISIAADVCDAYYRFQADLQVGELLRQTVKATAASLEAAQTLREAGNTTALQLYREQALHEEARLLLAGAEGQAVADREHLNRLMGVWDKQVVWRMPTRLPDVPSGMLDLTDLERRAITANLHLQALRSDLLAAARRAGLADRTDLIPDFEIGAGAEREEGAWDAGPSVAFTLPFFDQGQARKAAAYAEVRRLRQTYYAKGVDLRSMVRAAGHRVFNTRQRALHVANVVLPLRSRIVNESQLQLNAMQLGVFDLLTAERQQINAALEYVETRREYWEARTRLQQILNGSMPMDMDGEDASLALGTGMEAGGH